MPSSLPRNFLGSFPFKSYDSISGTDETIDYKYLITGKSFRPVILFVEDLVGDLRHLSGDIGSQIIWAYPDNLDEVLAKPYPARNPVWILPNELRF